jgi:hypothetical protein
MKLRTTTLALSTCSTLLLLGQSPKAFASDPTEFNLILLDRTGSMITSTGSSTTRWTDGLDSAINMINTMDLSDTSVQRAYAIWDFRLGAGTTNGDPNQTNAAPVWPKSDTDCKAVCSTCKMISLTSSDASITNNYCDFTNSGITDPYTNLIALLNGYKTDPNRMPDPNGNGRTPLSDSFCRVMNQIRSTASTVTQIITLETDGLENQSSLGDCGNYSVESSVANFISDPTFTWQKTVADWGMSAASGSGLPDAIDSTVTPGGGSWEARVVRRALRLTTPSSKDATAHYINYPSPTTTEKAQTNIAWRIGAHYTTFNNSLTAAATSATPTVMAVYGGDTRDIDLRSPQQFSAPAVAGLTASTTASATSTVTISIPQSELSLFRLMASPSFSTKGKSASRSAFQAVTLLPGQTYGTYHKLAGDVDDSGCTDGADYSILTQKDVWRQRALPPNQIAMRADLNKDGWVNEADRSILLAHWGEGCINKPGPAPKP